MQHEEEKKSLLASQESLLASQENSEKQMIALEEEAKRLKSENQELSINLDLSKQACQVAVQETTNLIAKLQGCHHTIGSLQLQVILFSSSFVFLHRTTIQVDQLTKSNSELTARCKDFEHQIKALHEENIVLAKRSSEHENVIRTVKDQNSATTKALKEENSRLSSLLKAANEAKCAILLI